MMRYHLTEKKMAPCIKKVRLACLAMLDQAYHQCSGIAVMVSTLDARCSLCTCITLTAHGRRIGSSSSLHAPCRLACASTTCRLHARVRRVALCAAAPLVVTAAHASYGQHAEGVACC
jgi:hypothetical protein